DGTRGPALDALARAPGAGACGMTERTYIDPDCDRSGWGEGPWDDEPDKVQWIDEATGLDCLAVRHPEHGNWCGYVGVAPGHPLHGAPYDEVYADVHGGLTFSDACQEHENPAQGVCHVPFGDRPADVWWLGFDCAHHMDLAPGLQARMRELRARHPDLRAMQE